MEVVAVLGASPAVLQYLGEQAIDALGLRASRCTVSQWIFDWPIFKEKIPHWEWPMLTERFELIDLPIERFVAGGILRALMTELGPQSGKATFPRQAPDDKGLETVMLRGVERGIAELGAQLQKEAALALQLSKAQFQFKRGKMPDPTVE